MIFEDNKVYDILRYITSIFLPAFGTLYFTLSQIWGLPYGEQVVGTITALVTFFGVLLGISKARYDKQTDEITAELDAILEKEKNNARCYKP